MDTQYQVIAVYTQNYNGFLRGPGFSLPMAKERLFLKKGAALTTDGMYIMPKPTPATTL